LAKTNLNVNKHILVPSHKIISEKEKEQLFKKYNVTIKELPKILIEDPAIIHLKPKMGDIVKIERESPTAGKISFYRGVIKWEKALYYSKNM